MVKIWAFTSEAWVWPLLGKLRSCKLAPCDQNKTWASQVELVVKNLPANAGDIRDASSIPGLGLAAGGGHGNPLQYSCLENPMDEECGRL